MHNFGMKIKTISLEVMVLLYTTGKSVHEKVYNLYKSFLKEEQK